MASNRKFCQILFTLACLSHAVDVYSLPKNPKVISGSSEFREIDSNVMEIRASDQAIVNYSKFDIGKNEKVKFIQKSSSSCVLNRVSGNDPSQILGSLESNGKVFLVNPNGIYFGSNSTVNVGSLIASTLDISDTDFLQENYQFNLGSKNSVICNEGDLLSPDGSIVLMAPQIQNVGTISARAGTVALLSGECVTLDFTGDGLVSFSVEGALKEALIEHLGEIKASTVALKMPVAKKAISEIVNLDGIEEGDIFIEENGVIKFASSSLVEAKKVLVEAANLEVNGSIDAKSLSDKGGEVHLFGRDIALEGAKVDVSGVFGGGEVLIGGEFQGKGKTSWASKVNMDEASEIHADAIEKGDGGLVVLWSHDKTLFNGSIFAQGGALGGDGGLVETSSKIDLGVSSGYVNTGAELGSYGNWLLDPSTLYVKSGDCPCDYSSSTNTYGGCSGGCSPCHIEASTFTGSNTTVTLQASQLIGIWVTINMTQPGAGLTCELCDSGTSLFFYGGGGITTNSGPITLPDSTGGNAGVFINTNVTLSTVGSGGSGADIYIPSVQSGVSPTPTNLTLNAGTGVITLNTKGNTDDTGAVTISSGSKVLSSRLVAESLNIDSSVPLLLSSSGVININGNIQLGSLDASASDSAIKVQSTSGSITINGAVGAAVVSGSVVPESFTLITSNTSTFSDITTGSGGISIQSPVSLASPANMTSSNGPITFSSTVNGANSMTLNSGSGAVTFQGAVGGTTPLSSLDITTSGGEISVEAPISGNTLMNIASNNGPITFSSTVDGVGSMTLNSGTGKIILQGVVGGTVPISTLGITTEGGEVSIQGPITVDSAININSGNGPITFSSTVDGPSSISLTAGTGYMILNGAVGGTTAISSFDVISGTYTKISSITTSGGNITIPTPVYLVSDSTLTTAGGDISFAGTVDGDSVGGETLTIVAGSGNVTFSSDIGDDFALKNFAITSAGNVGLGNITISGGSISSTSSGPITLAKDSTMTTGGGAIDLSGSIDAMTAGQESLTIVAGSGDISIQGDVGGSQALKSFSVSSSTSTFFSEVTADGAISIASPYLLTGSSSITSNSGSITFNSTIEGSSEGVGNLTLAAPSGALVFTNNIGSSNPLQSIHINYGNITNFVDMNTSGGDIYIVPSSTLNRSVTLTAMNGSIYLSGAINAASSDSDAEGLTLVPVNGSLTITGTLGGSKPLGALTITETTSTGVNVGESIFTTSESSRGGKIQISPQLTLTGNSTMKTTPSSGADILLGDISSASHSLTLIAGDASVEIGSVVSSGALSITGGLVSINGTVSGSSLSITNSDMLTISSGSISLTGGFQQLGAGGADLGEDITASTVSFAGDILLIDSPITLTSSAGESSFKNIYKGDDLSSAALTLDATGAITVNGSLSIDSLSITNCSGATITGITSVNTVNLNGGSGTISFQGPISITALNTVAANYGVLIGSGGVINSATSFLNTGGTTLRGGTTSLSFQGALTNTSSLTTILGVVGSQSGSISFQNLVFESGNSTLLANGYSVSVAGTTTLSGNATINSESQDITFTGEVEGPGSLSVVSGAGTVRFDSSVGASTPLASLTGTNVSYTYAKGVRAGGWIYITSDITLTESSTIFESAAGMVLGDINGTNLGEQSLRIIADSGGVSLGVIGGTVPLGEVLIQSTGSSFIQSITTQGRITITGDAILSSSTILNTTADLETGFDVTLNRVDGKNIGSQSLTINAGIIGAVSFNDSVGQRAPLSTLDIIGSSIFFDGPIVNVIGNQNYYYPVTVTDNCVFTTAGDITFYSTLDATSENSITSLYMGGGNVTFLAPVGDTLMGVLSVFNSGSFTAESIQAKALRVAGGLSTITLNQPVTLSGPLGILLDGGGIYLGGEIDAAALFFRSSGVLENLDEPQPINIAGDSPIVFQYFNALGGNVGSPSSPIEINTVNKSNVGANYRADFIGEPFHGLFLLDPKNTPCIITFNGVTVLDCMGASTPQELIVTVPKNLLYDTWTYSSWNNLSNEEFFEQEAAYPNKNPREKEIFFVNSKKRGLNKSYNLKKNKEI
jgi:filamentous hemagglutinin family protein